MVTLLIAAVNLTRLVCVEDIVIALQIDCEKNMIIDPTISEWLNLILRWIHVFAGIMWVGTTYYFTWLDARLTEEEKAVANTGNAGANLDGPQRRFLRCRETKVPDLASRTLHWFRWEAGTTWLSGFALLVLVYYLGGGALVDPDVYEISRCDGSGDWDRILLVGGFIYDVMMMSPLGRNEKAFAVVAYLLHCGVTLRLNTDLQRPRSLHPCGRDNWNDHGRQCLDAHPAGAKENDCGDQ